MGVMLWHMATLRPERVREDCPGVIVGARPQELLLRLATLGLGGLAWAQVCLLHGWYYVNKLGVKEYTRHGVRLMRLWPSTPPGVAHHDRHHHGTRQTLTRCLNKLWDSARTAWEHCWRGALRQGSLSKLLSVWTIEHSVILAAPSYAIHARVPVLASLSSFAQQSPPASATVAERRLDMEQLKA